MELAAPVTLFSIVVRLLQPHIILAHPERVPPLLILGTRQGTHSYGRLSMKRHWEIDDLVEQWTLLPDELAWLGKKTGSTRLGFALLLKFFQIEGRFPLAKNEIPPPVIRFLAKQIGVPMAEYIH